MTDELIVQSARRRTVFSVSAFKTTLLIET